MRASASPKRRSRLPTPLVVSFWRVSRTACIFCICSARVCSVAMSSLATFSSWPCSDKRWSAFLAVVSRPDMAERSCTKLASSLRACFSAAAASFRASPRVSSPALAAASTACCVLPCAASRAASWACSCCAASSVLLPWPAACCANSACSRVSCWPLALASCCSSKAWAWTVRKRSPRALMSACASRSGGSRAAARAASALASAASLARASSSSRTSRMERV
mmetsp:Transcript_1761/g.5577  ORF Transcript_1761/g.5577 Transcript_1761/m.5577 type:complete len:223 (-) Transcript_1761:220-888(-)